MSLKNLKKQKQRREFCELEQKTLRALTDASIHSFLLWSLHDHQLYVRDMDFQLIKLRKRHIPKIRINHM